MDWVYTLGGLVLLIFAGDALVKGAVNLALRLGLPALVVSLTIVAFGTSAPELLISVQSVLDGLPDIALGNVVGSNIANVFLVLGIPALFATLHTSDYDTKNSYLQMLAATALFVALAAAGPFGWGKGLVLLAALAAMITHAVRSGQKHRRAAQAEPELEGADPGMSLAKIVGFLIVGLIGLPIGAGLLVEGASNIARAYGVSETVIGLTLVAVGTSLPELATTVMAALRRQADVALGNVIGSNLFNLLGIIGVASLVGPIPVDPQFLQLDFWVMAGAALALFPFVFLKRDITRPIGIALVVVYVTYLVVLL